MKTKLVLSVIALVAIAAPVAYQQKTVAQLREQNQALQQQVSQLNTRAEATGSAQPAVDVAEVERLRAEHVELLQLRGEVGRLRKQLIAHGNGARRDSNAGLPVAKAAEAQAAQLAAENEARRISLDTVSAMKQLGLAARIFATDHNDKFPATFDEMKNELNGLATDRFEFVKHIREISEQEPQLILFREIQPRQLPDGSWARVYTFADGSVQDRRSPNGDFSAFEQEVMAKPVAPKEAVSN